MWIEREFFFDMEYFVFMCVFIDECFVDGDEFIVDVKEELVIWVGDYWYLMIFY